MSSKSAVQGKNKATAKAPKNVTVASNGRELKYNYPAKVKTPEDRKAFRRQTRSKVAQLEKGKDKVALKKFKEEVYA